MTKEEIIKYVQYLYDNKLSEDHTDQEYYDNDWRLDVINKFDSFDEGVNEYRIYVGMHQYYIFEDRYQDWKKYIRLKKLERIVNEK